MSHKQRQMACERTTTFCPSSLHASISWHVSPNSCPASPSSKSSSSLSATTRNLSDRSAARRRGRRVRPGESHLLGPQEGLAWTRRPSGQAGRSRATPRRRAPSSSREKGAANHKQLQIACVYAQLTVLDGVGGREGWPSWPPIPSRSAMQSSSWREATSQLAPVSDSRRSARCARTSGGVASPAAAAAVTAALAAETPSGRRSSVVLLRAVGWAAGRRRPALNSCHEVKQL